MTAFRTSGDHGPTTSSAKSQESPQKSLGERWHRQGIWTVGLIKASWNAKHLRSGLLGSGGPNKRRGLLFLDPRTKKRHRKPETTRSTALSCRQ